MKPQQRRRRRVPAAAATVAIICMGVGVVGISAESSSASSSSIRGVGGSGRVMRNSAATVSTRQQQHHQNNRQREQQQQQRYLYGNSGGEHTRGRHRKSDGDDDGTNSIEQQPESPQQQQEYSWNINPDKLAMLEATTTSDSDRQEDESSSSELDEPQQQQQAMNDDGVNDDVVNDDGVNDDGVNDDEEEGGASLSHHRDNEGGDDDGAVDDGDEANSDENDDGTNGESMVSMSAVFAYGNDQPVVKEEEDAIVSGEEEDIVSGSNGSGGGMSVYSLSDNTSTSESDATATSPGDEGVYFFPIWNNHVEGCTYYTTPPQEYVDPNEETQYLFSTKLDCCMAWFQKLEEYEACLDEDIILTDHPVTMKEWGMVYEVQEERNDDDDYDMVAQSAPVPVTSPSDTSSFGETMPHHDDEYYPANYADADAPSPASSPEFQTMPNQEGGYYPADFEDSAPPAASPESQPMPHHEAEYYPANNVDSDSPPAPSPQSPPELQPLPHHEDGYYPANYVAPSPSSTFDNDASPPPTDSSTTTVGDEDAISGESIISDLVLEAKLKDNTIMPALNLQASPEDVPWEIMKHDFDYDGGKYVLSANTRKVILGMAANSRGITTYHGSATMSVTILAGPAGGVLTFGSYSNARAPIEVLQIKVDDLPMIAVTSPSSEWVDHTLEIPAGKHVVTFAHISNPEDLSMKDLEGLGKPGSTMVDGMKYVDNVGPPEEFTSSAITEAPTTSPWSESDDEETVDASSTTTLPMQNYCGKSLALIQESCYTADDPPTCNDGDGPCPEGLFCWGNVECQVPEGEVAGGVSAMENPPPTVQVTSAPTSSPTALTSESFLDSFMFEEGSQSDQAVPKQTGCLEGYPPVQGLAGCCVPEPTFLGDGACDAHFPYNTAECGYDLGDCCKESCDTDAQFGCKAKEGDAYGPFGFYCIDPRYSTIDESCTAENREWIGDGGCDAEFNTEACGWDGGDCCMETCDTEFAYYECGREEQPFNCLDPDIIHQFEYVPGKR